MVSAEEIKAFTSSRPAHETIFLNDIKENYRVETTEQE
jgi:hypothetical protein